MDSIDETVELMARRLRLPAPMYFLQNFNYFFVNKKI